jgi:carbon starvation protein CstA
MLLNWFTIQVGPHEGLLKMIRASVRIEEFIVTEVLMTHIPGVSLKILIDSNVLWDKFGIANQIIKSVKNLHC